MRTDIPQTIYLKDYTPYPFEIADIELDFDIREGKTTVTAKSRVRKKDSSAKNMFLNGEHIELKLIEINGKPATNYIVDDKGLTINDLPQEDEFTLKIVTLVKPEENTRLEGLYKSGDTYCTQCEAEGFRSITYFPDRPDVLTTYTVRIEADNKLCPVLLSNGNKIDAGKIDDDRHYTIWHDPFPKPCYLFALVAGKLTRIHDKFTTQSRKNVDLFIYVRPGDEDQCDHAMQSLKRAMKWDEETYGLEYDLDIFNIVAVSDFNMGAMENKSLNIFNTALVLARPETATDTDFIRVESVIAHEYFHNWSGNRVTCRDWFQLSLKEGLTVFRDQEFSKDMHSRDVQRIDEVTHIRRYQFPEDAGPLAHPVRPDNYIEINNFYTMTVYEKGAEVIRMMRTILGNDNYRKGTDLYFSRYDGQAVTCDDFVACMEEASGKDLGPFKLWYSQAGTPQVKFSANYDPVEKKYNITLSQKTPPTPGQDEKYPLHIPVAISLYDPSAQEYDLGNGEKEVILHLKQEKQSFSFDNIQYPPIASVLRGFSAPVKLESELSNDDLAFLSINDTDGFNRWESFQTYSLRVINKMIDEGENVPEEYINSFGKLLDISLREDGAGNDNALMARMIQIPDISRIGQDRKEIDPDAIYDARDNLINTLLDYHRDSLLEIYNKLQDNGEFSNSPEAIGKRALKNSAFYLLTNKCLKFDADLSHEAYIKANNMTDKIAALHRLVVLRTPICEQDINDFYETYKSHPLVIDKWFAVQAGAIGEEIWQTLTKLRNHPDFNIKNPNRVRSLYSAFAMNNPVCFHSTNGRGYKFLQDAITELNSINPQMGARLLTPLREWKLYTADRRQKMQKTLENILQIPDISPDIYEVASKCLSN